MLRSLESKLADLVEGTFSRAFKSEVRPVEIARKLAREMDQHKVASVSRTYVPNEYTVWLSPRDREQFSGYEGDLRDELSAYLLEHARRERVAFLTRPEIGFETDERLRLGEFGIQARLVESRGRDQEPIRGEAGHTSVYSTAKRISEPLAEATEGRRSRAQLRYEGRATTARVGRRRARPLPRLRPRRQRRERLPPPRRGAPQRKRLGRARPGLHQRRQGQRPAHRWRAAPQ